uniref:Glycerophosphoryl diester phosphodiesterase membrane domain-containing protein n=1 Tax=Caulobacter sp. (strain K31) TaxID=366602 RepID=B0T864_CAUSK
MTTFSPVQAALEGVRMTRHKPLVVLAWAACYFAMLVVLGLVVAFAFGGTVRADLALMSRTNDLRELIDIVARRKGTLLPLIALAVALQSVITVAIMRAVVRPADRRLAYIRIGAEEGRQFIVALVGWVAALVVTALPSAVLVLIGAGLISLGAVETNRWVEVLGAIAVAGLSIWAGVRLSLLSITTFAEGKLDLRRTWRLTDHHFWQLLVMYALALVITILISVVQTIVAGLILGFSGGATNTVMLALTGLANLLLAPFFFTVQMVILTAAPARAYHDLHESERAPAAA